METKLQKVSLETLGGGAAKEMFEHELREVLKNIADPGAAAEDARTVRLEVKITPNEERVAGEMEILVSSKLAKIKTSTIIHIGMENGQLVAYEPNYQQLNLDLPKDKIIEMKPSQD